MVVKTTKGYFEILKNVREAFNLETFEAYYIEEIFDKYDYLVIDYADEKPRIKGFESRENSKVYFHTIMDYVVESCNYLAPFAILHRVDEAFYEEHKNEEETESITKPLGVITPIVKENFDKDNLVLDETKSAEPNVHFDSMKYNNIQLFELPLDIRQDIEKEKLIESRQRMSKKNKSKNNNNGKEKTFAHINSNRK